MKVENMKSKTGRSVPNQFILTTLTESGKAIKQFQSYRSIIVRKTMDKEHGCFNPIVELDKTYWDYSATTSKYRNQFLGETTKETKAKIASGEYILADLN